MKLIKSFALYSIEVKWGNFCLELIPIIIERIYIFKYLFFVFYLPALMVTKFICIYQVVWFLQIDKSVVNFFQISPLFPWTKHGYQREPWLTPITRYTPQVWVGPHVAEKISRLRLVFFSKFGSVHIKSCFAALVLQRFCSCYSCQTTC